MTPGCRLSKGSAGPCKREQLASRRTAHSLTCFSTAAVPAAAPGPTSTSCFCLLSRLLGLVSPVLAGQQPASGWRLLLHLQLALLPISRPSPVGRQGWPKASTVRRSWQSNLLPCVCCASPSSQTLAAFTGENALSAFCVPTSHMVTGMFRICLAAVFVLLLRGPVCLVDH